MQVRLVNHYFFRYSVFSMILYVLYPTQLREVIKTYFGIQTKNAARSSTIKVSVTFISAFCKYTVYIQMHTVEPPLSELFWGKGFSYNRTVRKIKLPFIYIQSFAQLL